MTTVPEDLGISTPETGFIVAVVVLPLLQVPPVLVEDMVTAVPTHTLDGPEIDDGGGITVTVVVAGQPPTA